MSDAHKIQLKANIELTSRQLVSVWLLTIFLPVLTLVIGSDFFLREYLQYAQAGAIQKGLQQVEKFRSLLVPEKYLHSKIENLNNLSYPADDTPVDLKAVKRDIDALIKAKSVFCAFYKDDGQQVKIIADRPDDIARNSLPIPFIRAMIEVALTEVDYSAADNLQSFLAEERSAAQRAQHTFRTIAPIYLKPNKPVKNYSIYFGGELYFMLVPFNRSVAEFDGALIMVRGAELAVTDIIDCARSVVPDCDVPLVKYDLEEIHRKKQTFASNVAVDGNIITILAPVGQNFIRFYQHSGGVKLTSNDLTKIPFIRFVTDICQQNSTMVKAIDLSKRIGWLLSLVSGLWVLKSCLLGMTFIHGFRIKILALTLVAAILPFAMFAATLYLHQQYLLNIARINLAQHLDNRISQINDQLIQFQSYVEAETEAAVNDVFSAVMPGDIHAIDESLRQLAERVPFTKAIYYDKDTERPLELADRVSSVGSRQNPDFMLKFLAQTSLKALAHDQRIFVDQRNLYEMEVQGNRMRTSSINDGLNAAGKMFPLTISQLPQWYILRLMVLPATEVEIPLAALIIQFEVGALLDAFFKSRTGVFKSLAESAFGYNISYGFFPIDSTGSTHVWNGHYSNTLEQIGEDLADQTKSEVFINKCENSEQICFSNINNTFPHRLLAMAEREDAGRLSAVSLYKTLAAGLVFLLLVFFIADRLLKIMFLQPTVAMADAARAIARGGERWDLKLATKDEFGLLSSSFGTMVEGLQQRNMLKDYVADSAISAAEKQTGMQLSPGGENLEVSVLFAALKNFSETTANMGAEELVKLINEFVGVTDVAARDNGGEIDKIIEGTVMIVFRASSPDDIAHAINAVKTAEQIAKGIKQKGRALCAGISSGSVISGRIGSYEGKLDYTVIGDTVNLAARLKAEAPASDTGIIVSGATMRLLKGQARVRFLRRCRLKGKAREYNIYEFDSFRDL